MSNFNLVLIDRYHNKHTAYQGWLCQNLSQWVKKWLFVSVHLQKHLRVVGRTTDLGKQCQFMHELTSLYLPVHEVSFRTPDTRLPDLDDCIKFSERTM